MIATRPGPSRPLIGRGRLLLVAFHAERLEVIEPAFAAPEMDGQDVVHLPRRVPDFESGDFYRPAVETLARLEMLVV